MSHPKFSHLCSWKTAKILYLFSLCPPDYSLAGQGHLSHLRVSQCGQRLSICLVRTVVRTALHGQAE